VKRILLASLLAACVSLLSGCWNGRLLIAVEEPFWTAEGGDALLRWPLVRTSLVHGYFPRFLLIHAQEDAGARLARALQARRYRAAVIGPLLSLQQHASFSPSTKVLVVEDQAVPLQDSVARLEFDRTSAFRIAGLAAGLSVGQEAGGTITNALASRIGILVSAHPPGTSNELTAFTQGVAQALDGGQPSVRSLSDPVDRNAMKAAIDQMRRDGVEIFLLFTGASDSWALEDLKDSGGSAVVSDWEASGAFPRQVFLSIETDLVGGVALFLAGRENPQGIVNGPVRIVAAQARPIPPQVAAQVARKAPGEKFDKGLPQTYNFR
jgi:hypothetical protein